MSTLLPADQRELLRAMNARTAPVPEHTLAAQLADAARQYAAEPALIAPGMTLSHAELDARVAAVAARLTAAGVAPGDRVALAVEYGAEQVVGALAALRAGAVCLPVDPGAARPVRWERVDRAKAAAVLTQSWLAERIDWPSGTQLVPVDGPQPLASARTLGSAADPAYELDTAVSHRAVATAALEVNRAFAVGPGDRLLALSPAGSPLALYDLFGPLLAGAAVVLVQDIDLRTPRALDDALRTHGVTVWNSPPALLGLLLDHLAERGATLPESLRLLLLSGERLDPAFVRRLRAAAPHGPTVAHLAAATPSGPWTTCMEVGELVAEWRSVPIGAPLPNQRVHILSEAMKPCPVWVAGRVHHGGVAAEQGGHETVAHPETGETLVRGSQFARLLPEGVIDIVGDERAQVTVRGRRLNLQDTESALTLHEAVHSAVVVPVREGQESLASVRLQPGATAGPDELLAHLRRKVSPYLLPGRIEIVDALPLTSDGRVDRDRIAAEATVPAPPATPTAAPSTRGEDELLAAVTRVTCRVLGLSAVEPHMNLLDAGATSMELVRLATALEEELGIDTDIEELLGFPSVAVIVGKHLGGQRSTAQAALITGIGARQAFKDAHHGTRHAYDDTEGIPLTGPDDHRLVARRSHRRFAPDPVPLSEVAQLLGALRELRQDGEAKYGYPSAGSAYPVQTYLLVHGDDRVTGLPAGSYYHHPARNRLVSIDPAATLDATAHAEINRAVFQQAAFSLHLIAAMDAITPLYAELSWDFTIFEAGAMTQLLMETAATTGLGLCPVGTMDPAPLRDLFALGDQHRFVHALLGGRPRTEAP
ncbi:AMP-binding protein [Streptomyces sp. NPDC052396]|uniref:AMP-binding protein n=1 Tax=Streptomyces sp. NPDC052396 TaxID=3365689 RepID=UPI0037D5D36F